MSKSEEVLQDKTKLLTDLMSLHAKLRPIVLASGVRDQHYDAPMKNVDVYNPVLLEALYDWLKEFEAGPYNAVYQIWRLKPEDWWFNTMVLFQMKASREHTMLKAERKKLRKAWYKRHEGSTEDETQNPVDDSDQGSVA